MSPSRTAVLLSLSLALAACATPQQRAASTEDDLSAAGFLVQPVNSPARTAMLARLPPNQLFRTVRGDDVRYVYADPVNCHCLYTGGQQAYNAFQAARQARQIANDQLLAAQTYQDSTWDWGPWGFGPGWGYGF